MITVQRIHRRHASIMLACLCLSATTQLGLITWLSIVPEIDFSESPEAIGSDPLGVLINKQTGEMLKQPPWVFNMPRPLFSDHLRYSEPGSPVLRTFWGRRLVSRTVAPDILDRFSGFATTPVHPDEVPGWATTDHFVSQDSQNIIRYILDIAVGWPKPALALTYITVYRPSFHTTVIDGFDILTQQERSTPALSWPIGAFPLRVYWPGMLVNVLLGTLMWMFPLIGLMLIRSARARRRTQQGKCGTCGYGPWNTQTPCPECGAPNTQPPSTVNS